LKLTCTASLLALSLVACGPASEAHDHDHDHEHAMIEGVDGLVCVLSATEGNDTSGTVTFSEGEDGVTITANVSGLEAGKKHAIHVHEFGDVRAADGTGCGGHYNPEGHDHGLPDASEMRHAGDLGNLEADGEGNATMTITVDNASLVGKNALIGRSIIVHAGEDDGGQPTGNAGPRIAQGVIGVAKP